MSFMYKTNNQINAQEIIEIFNSVGWEKNRENIVSAFKNSYYVTAYDENKLIGFARAISDNYYYTSIFDVIVRPEYQKKGVGRNMMNILRKKFVGTYFFLTYTEGNKGFYEKCGFVKNNSSMFIKRRVKKG